MLLGGCLLAPVADIKGLADGILRLLADPDLASTLSQAAHENASSYTWQQIAPRLLASYGLAPFKSPSQVSIDNELR